MTHKLEKLTRIRIRDKFILYDRSLVIDVIGLLKFNNQIFISFIVKGTKKQYMPLQAFRLIFDKLDRIPVKELLKWNT